MAKLYSSAEVASEAGVSRITLFSWVSKGYVPKPKQQQAGNLTVWLWSDGELQKVLKFKTDHFRGKGKSKPRSKKAK